MLRHSDRRIVARATALAAVLAALAACGIKGPLQPPPKAAAQKPAASAQTPAAPTETQTPAPPPGNPAAPKP